VKAVGLRGEVKLLASGDFWEGALASQSLRLRSRKDEHPVQVLESRVHGPGTWVLQVAGAGDRTAAESLVGSELWLAAGATDVTPPDSLRPFQVRGMRVQLADGSPIGEVVDVLALPAQDVLVVRDGAREHLIPQVAAIVLEIDQNAGIVRIDPPPGLLDLGA
jgi:16S rRNA processing protein RimM